MQIIINTEQPLSDEDRQVLAVLAGTTVALAGEVGVAAPAKAAPAAKKAAAPKAAAKPAPAPEPEPADDDDDLVGDAPTMADAVARATALVGAGEASRVKTALADLGVKKVSELKTDDDIAAFVTALED